MMHYQEIDWSGEVKVQGRKMTVPAHTMQALKSYIEDGLPPGGFLTAVLEDKLTEAYLCTDNMNFWAMPAIVQWIYWNAPTACRRQNIKSWIKMHQDIRRMKQQGDGRG